MGRKKYEGFKKSAATAIDALDSAYMVFVQDKKARHEAGLGEAPEAPQVSDAELKNKYPALNGQIPIDPGAMAATGKPAFKRSEEERKPA
jgi:hypothetical protein